MSAVGCALPSQSTIERSPTYRHYPLKVAICRAHEIIIMIVSPTIMYRCWSTFEFLTRPIWCAPLTPKRFPQIPALLLLSTCACAAFFMRIRIGAACYFCLEEEEEGMPLVRDCSCRGNSGYAHFSCLAKYAEQKSKRAETEM